MARRGASLVRVAAQLLVPADRPTTKLLRALVAARAADDPDAAREAWRELVVLEHTRVKGIVGAFRHEALPNGRIPREDVDHVVSDVFIRLHGAAFRGEEIAQLRAFVASTAKRACQDHMRKHVRRDKGVEGSLDASGRDGEGTSAVALEAQRTTGDHVDPARIVTEGAHVRDALARVDPDKREVLELLGEGHGAPEIAERLGLSVENVYQRRSRGAKQLRAFLDEDPV